MPMRKGGEVGGCTTTEKQSLADDAEFLWNVWEVHVMILASLFLQVFLFLFAGMRRRCKSSVPNMVLWLAYLSADSVAIFVLGHLAIRASKSGHHLMYFWAPFVLVHLGGQDTITAMAKQDNELWGRHLLNLVTQATMVGYVVSRASWPDRRLKAAMVIIFLSGCIKYAERTLCLITASPDSLKLFSLNRRKPSFFEDEIEQQPQIAEKARDDRTAAMREALDAMRKGTPVFWTFDKHIYRRILELGVFDDIFFADPPLNRELRFTFSDNLPSKFKVEDFLSDDEANLHRPYEYVAAWLVHCYRCLYTKFGLRLYVFITSGDFIRNLQHIVTSAPWGIRAKVSLLLLYALFHYVSAPIAMVLFWTAEKDQVHTSSSRADITVSYILLVGALILDVSSAILFFLEYMSIMPDKAGKCRSTIIGVAIKMKLLLPCCRKEWCQDIDQYNMIENRAIGPSVSRTKLGAKFASIFFEAGASISIPKNGKPILKFILDNLSRSGTREEWTISNSRGRIAINKWMDKHRDTDFARTTWKALGDSLSFEFPTSVLIWHIATDMCYYYVGDSTSTEPEKTKNDKRISRELSNYIMHLIFKCGVNLTVNFQIVLEKTNAEIRDCLFDYEHITSLFEIKSKLKRTDDVVNKLFEAMKNKDSVHTVEEPVNEHENSVVIEIQKDEVNIQEDSMVNKNQKHGEQTNMNSASGIHVQNSQRARAVKSEILPQAYQVARALIKIEDDTERWRLIVEVWAEMLYYIAPRCGASFHYEKLSTGGEFITHVLLLMYFLGPFLPPQ